VGWIGREAGIQRDEVAALAKLVIEEYAKRKAGQK
jgi:hypothetical protein